MVMMLKEELLCSVFLSINYIRDYIRMQLNNGTGIQNGYANSFTTLVDVPLGKNEGAVLWLVCPSIDTCLNEYFF